MKIQNQITRSGALLAMLATCFVYTGTARADHQYDILRAKADAVFHSMIDLDRTLVDSYVRSRVFGEMMAVSARIKSKALYLRGMAYHGSACTWAVEIDRLDAKVHKLESLIETAHYRADQGLDPPISYCSIEAGRRLAAVTELIHCMQNALAPAPVVVRNPIRQPTVCTPRGCYTPTVSPRTSYNNGYGQSYGRSYGGSYNSRNAGHGYKTSYGSGGYGKGYNNNGITIGQGGLGLRINF